MTDVPRETLVRLTELGERYGLPSVEPLAALLRVLRDDPAAPTTVTDPAAGVDVHVADALVALEVEAVSRATSLADLGAGAGIPGLVLALARPGCDVRLVESVGKKCAFIDRAAEAMGLRNARAVQARAEGWPDGLGAHDVVTARALAPLTALVEYAGPLLRDGGALVAWKGHRDPEEEADGAAAADAVGLELAEVRRVDPFPAADARHLYVYLKVRETPPMFPRREGMARKRPIRA